MTYICCPKIDWTLQSLKKMLRLALWVLYTGTVNSFKFVDINVRGLREKCISLDTKICGYPVIISTYVYSPKYSMNS